LDNLCGYPDRRGTKTGRCFVKLRLRTPALSAIAIVSGAIVLLGYFIRIPLLSGLRSVFLSWALILSAIALVVGVLNLFNVHINKLKAGGEQAFFSGILMFSLVVTFVVVVFFGLTSQASLWIFNYLLLPVEASLVGILAIALLYALVRLFYRKLSLFYIIFVATAFFVLAATAMTVWFDLPELGFLRDWVTQTWSLGGTRAILIGVSLGAIATGLRVLLGADRPYEG